MSFIAHCWLSERNLTETLLGVRGNLPGNIISNDLDLGGMAAILKVKQCRAHFGFGMGTLPSSRATIICGTYAVIANNKSLVSLFNLILS